MNVSITCTYFTAALLCALTASTANVTHSQQQLPMDVAKLIATFSHEPEHVTLSGRHTDSVYSVACSSNFDGTNGYIITGSKDNTAKVWRLRPNDLGELLPELVTTLTGHTNLVFSVACSSNFDGANGYIITGSKDNTAKIWKLRPNDQGELLPELVTTLTGHTNLVFSVACSSNFDGTNGYIITGSADNTAQVWKLRPNDQGELLPELVTTLSHTNLVFSVACSSNFDGTNGYIITGSTDNTAQVWRMGPDQGVVNALAAATPDELARLRPTDVVAPQPNPVEPPQQAGLPSNEGRWGQTAAVIASDLLAYTLGL